MTGVPIGLNVVYLITKMDLAVIQRRSEGSYIVEIGVGRGGQKLKGKIWSGGGTFLYYSVTLRYIAVTFGSGREFCFLIDLF